MVCAYVALRTKKIDWYALRGAEDKEDRFVCACALRKKSRNGRSSVLRTKSGIDMRLRVSPFLKTRSKNRGPWQRMMIPLL